MQRKRVHVVPPHVEYTLSPLGKEAATKVRELADWVEAHYAEVLVRQKAQVKEERR